ncbi:oxidoreductase [Cocleimonas sp. KMM 6892]|uniref:acrylyl-CoA reductase (NADPH) n=1 Tax=unclassified Cocleimonas TaxID=2639732 RepID=UPI002DBD29DA|nr:MULTISPECIES: MDR family oxidoreductase [unclassified Cocleimonas]MEB8430994.1 oxidoreductase [Cocleimonas sp. KMM 6892]MEC4714234.1 oxidoreductase [Cocleimonas sp. KMM 6895]MEC4743565.1 oxidoreductase [Cocleimonas sp. KMM 6896]
MSFNALLINRSEDKKVSASLETIDESQLPEDGDVIVDIDYSTLNYKDGLAITGAAPVVRKYPMVPGIDFAGTVSESSNSNWKTGDKVILNGWGVGEGHWGGLAQKAKVKGEWLIAKPERLNSYQAMAIGTAGYTAMLCVMALQKHDVKPEDGEILVTGANGGVGSFAIAILSAYGYDVVASTGRPEEMDYLTELGAKSSINRSELSEPGKPLDKERWAGVVDAVGSHTLANACAQTKYGGTVAACGLAQGFDLPATVMPFILRGVTLAGVDSVNAPLAKRQEAWDKIAEILSPEVYEKVVKKIALSEAIDVAGQLLEGKVRGRVVVDVNA